MKLITLNISFGLAIKIFNVINLIWKGFEEYAYLKFDKLIKFKLEDV